MKNSKHEIDKDLIFNTLHQNWEGAVSVGLRRLSDDELLRLLSEVNTRLDDADAAVDDVFAEAPDWDDRSAAELDVIASQFEHQIAAGTSSSATPVRVPLRRRPRNERAPLTFEELESRYAPSAFTVISHGRAAYAPACACRLTLTDEYRAWETSSPARAAVHGGNLDHLLLDFDTEALGHMALAQVA